MKIKNMYEGSILDLNMIDVHEYRRSSLSAGEILILAIPILLTVAIVMGNSTGDIVFLAQCLNIAGGDICTIELQ